MHLKILIPLALLAAPAFVACSSTKSQVHDDTISEEEMMAKWAELATPGENHKKLEPLVGTFKARVRWRMAPDAPWTESTGTMRSRWSLGNRFVLREYKSDTMEHGELFEGIGLVGYDNAKRSYVSFWVDSWGTAIQPPVFATMTGNTLTMTGSYEDPTTNETMKYREVWTIPSDAQHTQDMYGYHEGKEFKSLEIAYTRM